MTTFHPDIFPAAIPGIASYVVGIPDTEGWRSRCNAVLDGKAPKTEVLNSIGAAYVLSLIEADNSPFVLPEILVPYPQLSSWTEMTSKPQGWDLPALDPGVVYQVPVAHDFAPPYPAPAIET